MCCGRRVYRRVLWSGKILMATPHRLLAAVYTHGPRFSGFEQQVNKAALERPAQHASSLSALARQPCDHRRKIRNHSLVYWLNKVFVAVVRRWQDAQDFLYFLLERASEELKEASPIIHSNPTLQSKSGRMADCSLGY